jgi:hypothetical protein
MRNLREQGDPAWRTTGFEGREYKSPPLPWINRAKKA